MRINLGKGNSESGLFKKAAVLKQPIERVATWLKKIVKGIKGKGNPESGKRGQIVFITQPVIKLASRLKEIVKTVVPD